jgi:hypothetical protein
MSVSVTIKNFDIHSIIENIRPAQSLNGIQRRMTWSHLFFLSNFFVETRLIHHEISTSFQGQGEPNVPNFSTLPTESGT